MIYIFKMINIGTFFSPCPEITKYHDEKKDHITMKFLILADKI